MDIDTQMFSRIISHPPNPVLHKQTLEFIEKARPLLGELTTANTDKEAEPSGEIGEQKRTVLEVLSLFRENLNGQATEMDHQFLEAILTEKQELNGDTLKSLLGIAERIKSEEELREKLSRQIESRAREIAKESSSNTTGISDDASAGDRLKHYTKRILKREIANRSGIIGLIAGFVTVPNPDKTKFGEEERISLSKFVEGSADDILDTKFMSLLQESIQGKNDISLEELKPTQQYCFKVAKFVTKAIGFLPPWAFEIIPVMGHVFDWCHPFLAHTPLIGRIYQHIFPFLAEGTRMLGTFNEEATGLKKAVEEIRSEQLPKSD